MPIYEYRCQACDRVFEVMQALSDAPLETCDECGGKLRKLFSAPAFQFKGSGWYVTDYARKDAKAGATDSKSTEGSSSDKSDSGKSDAGKSDGGKSDGGKSDGGKKSDADGASSKSSGASGSPASDPS